MSSDGTYHVNTSQVLVGTDKYINQQKIRITEKNSIATNHFSKLPFMNFQGQLALFYSTTHLRKKIN